ncbi:MAG TPA: hypothetical protein VGJ13_12885 [Pseudonocardiaceae bacterium]|jgi:hypothetical protein
MRWTTCDLRDDSAEEMVAAVNEQRLGELFHDAVGETPPASFGRDDVVAASRRATARRRNALTGGTLVGVAVLAAGLAAGGQVLHGQAPDAGGRDAGRQDAAGAVNPGNPGTLRTLIAPAHPQPPTPRSDSAVSAQATCGPVDNQLVTEMTAVLAQHGNGVSGPAGQMPSPCPAGSRSAAVPVAGGTFFVLVFPPASTGSSVARGTPPPAGSPVPVDPTKPDDWSEYALILHGGRVLVLISVPPGPGQAAPLADEVPELAQELTDRI